MFKRRDALKLGAAAAGAGLASKYAMSAPPQHVIERQPGNFPQSADFPSNIQAVLGFAPQSEGYPLHGSIVPDACCPICAAVRSSGP